MAGADAGKLDAYVSLTTTVQTIKTPANATFTVYLFTNMYAKNTAWEKTRPRDHGQRPPINDSK